MLGGIRPLSDQTDGGVGLGGAGIRSSRRRRCYLVVDQVAVGISQSLSSSNTALIYSILIVAVGELVIYNT